MNDKQRFLFIPQEYLALLNNCPLFLDSTLLEVRKNRNVRTEKEEGEGDTKMDKRELSKKKIRAKIGGRSLTSPTLLCYEINLAKTALILCNFP